jgi:ubiquinol-cytochrome c reductase cytochrome b subunit
MLHTDPELRGEDLFARHCAGCHVLGDLGDKAKATAPTLDGWGTEAWVLAMIHDPDGDARFGRTPYKEGMPSMDIPPKDPKPDDPPFKPMSKEDMHAVAAFLASGGVGDTPKDERLVAGDALRDTRRGETIVRERCTECHIYKGDGDLLACGRAPELSGYGSLAWVRAQIAAPATKATYREQAVDTPASKGHMPRFDGELAPADLDILARWVRAHARGIPDEVRK